MISSMTGFGAHKAENDFISIDVQMKTVNGRFLEPRFRMPKEYLALEGELRQLLTDQISRGTVDVFVTRTPKPGQKAVTLNVNYPLAQGWLDAVQELGKKLKLKSEISLDALVKVPDLLQYEENRDSEKAEKELLLKVFRKALESCLAEKKREGETQLKTFTGLLDELEAFVNKVKSKKVQLDLDLQKNLQKRLADLQKETSIDPHRLAQEALFLLDKADIAEEIARAMAHIDAFRKMIRSKPPMGKKLDFYTQELHREVNTMGAKTQNLGVVLDIIEAKTVIERMREQVQNVE